MGMGQVEDDFRQIWLSRVAEVSDVRYSQSFACCVAVATQQHREPEARALQFSYYRYQNYVAMASGATGEALVAENAPGAD